MKSLSFLYTIAAATAACGLALTAVSAQVPVPAPPQRSVTAPPVAAPETDVPLGRQCVVSVATGVLRSDIPASTLEAAGFNSDGTVRGILIRLSDGWCVLKEGDSESWIPLEKVLMIRTR